MNEKALIHQVRTALNQRSGEISPEAAQRLALARQAALARHRPAQRHGLRYLLQPVIDFHRHALRVSAIASVTVIALGAGTWWWQQDPANEIADVDVQLLSDELPPHTYLDEHFQQWLAQASDAS